MAKQITTLFKKDYYILFLRDYLGRVFTLVDPLVATNAAPHWLVAQDDTPFYHFDRDLVRDNALRLRNMEFEKLTANLPPGTSVTDRTVHIRRVQQTVHDVSQNELEISRLYKTKGHDAQFNEDRSAGSGPVSFLLEDDKGNLAVIRRKYGMGVPAYVVAKARAIYDLRKWEWLKSEHKDDLRKFIKDHQMKLEDIPEATSVADFSYAIPLTIAYEHAESGFYCGSTASNVRVQAAF